MCIPKIQKIITINSGYSSRVISGNANSFTYMIDVPPESLDKFKYVELLNCEIDSPEEIAALSVLVRCSLVNNLNDNELVTLYPETNTENEVITFSKQNCTIIHPINRNVNQSVTVTVSDTSISPETSLSLTGNVRLVLRLFD